MRKLIYILLILFVACTTEDKQKAPKISFANQSDIYVVKVGKTITIEPVVENDINATYLWTSGGNVLSKEKTLSYSWDKNGQVYITFKVVTDYGEDEKEIRVDVAMVVPPKINLAVPEGGYEIQAGEELRLAPSVDNSQGSAFKWSVDGKEVSTQKEYVFKSDKIGVFKLSLNTENADGKDALEFVVNVKAPSDMPFSWAFEKYSYNVSVGRTIPLTPFSIKNAFDAKYIWVVEGKEVQNGANPLYAFNAEKEGVYDLVVTMKNAYNEVSQRLTVNVSPQEGKYKREVSSSSLKGWNRIYEFMSAPGQFVNENYVATTMEQAISYAEKRLRDGAFISLGGFGGYVVLGFDHSVDNDGGYNFQIYGNSFNGSSEPGIVWVMQDENGDGAPNDTWYELKGSEYGKAETIQNYEVTYYRPSSINMPVEWSDNRGNSGYIEYLSAYHTQEYYYPLWIKENSYVLRGTCLKSRTIEVSEGYWSNNSFGWGYADNFSSIDRLTEDDNHNAGINANHFKISDAVTFDGKPANLGYIDFIKIQSGVNAKAGWLGENSTEVFGVMDYNLIKK